MLKFFTLIMISILIFFLHFIRSQTNRDVFSTQVFRVYFDTLYESHCLFQKVDFMSEFKRDEVSNTIFTDQEHFGQQCNSHNILQAARQSIYFSPNYHTEWVYSKVLFSICNNYEKHRQRYLDHILYYGLIFVVILLICLLSLVKIWRFSTDQSKNLKSIVEEVLQIITLSFQARLVALKNLYFVFIIHSFFHKI